jgi:hypothetical protein
MLPKVGRRPYEAISHGKRREPCSLGYTTPLKRRQTPNEVFAWKHSSDRNPMPGDSVRIPKVFHVEH